MNWQPISTAPKDGTGILVLWNTYGFPVCASSYGVVRFDGGQWVDVEDPDDSYGAPAYWMPLPPPPESE